MFDELASRLGDALRKLTGRGRLSEQDVRDASREIRRVLLEADVNLAVARDFCRRIEERAVGGDVLQGITPGQQVVKVVYDELVRLLGGPPGPGFQYPSDRAAVLLLVGLSGSGKTTSAAKLARHWKTRGKRVLLAALDLKRPAAIDQLEVLARSIDAPVLVD
jgi:signal recognition particle subunit SRP54